MLLAAKLYALLQDFTDAQPMPITPDQQQPLLPPDVVAFFEDTYGKVRWLCWSLAYIFVFCQYRDCSTPLTWALSLRPFRPFVVVGLCFVLCAQMSLFDCHWKLSELLHNRYQVSNNSPALPCPALPCPALPCPALLLLLAALPSSRHVCGTVRCPDAAAAVVSAVVSAGRRFLSA